MANNLIQIKRSLNTAVPASLANGELAYTSNGDVLYIGANGAIQPIGGMRNPGTLTANQALVANATGYIDMVKTANLVVTGIEANGSYGPTNGILSVNSSGGVFWAAAVAATPGGSNTYVQINDEGALGAYADFTFNKSTKVLAVNGDVNSNTSTITSSVSIGNSTVNSTVNSTALTVGSSLVSNTTGLFHTGKVNATSVTVGTDVTANSIGVFATGTVNAATLSVGTNFKANTTQVTIGSGVGLSANGGLGSAGQVLHSDGASVYWSNTVADITEVTAANGISGGGTSGAVSVSVNAQDGLIANTSGLFVKGGDGISVSGVNGVAVIANSGLTTNATGVYVLANNGITSNSSGIFVKESNGISVGPTGVSVNASHGLSTNSSGVFVVGNTGVTVNAAGVFIGQPVATTDNVTFNDITINGNTVLGSNGSDLVTINGKVNTAIVPSANNTYDLGSSGLRWKDLYLSGTSLIIGDQTVSSNSTGISLGGNAVFATDINVSGNTKLGDSSADIVQIIASVNTNIMPSANNTYNLGNNTIRWNEVHTQNVHSDYGYFDRDVTISGNLYVTGNVTSVNVETLSVTDSLIQLASNNTTSDVIDIGFYGSYNVGGSPHEHAGLFRDASNDGIFRLFQGLEESPTATVNVAGVGYTTGTLDSYLQSGGLVSNSSAVTITANSSLAVSITANSLTLTTALASTSGGTGQNTYTSGDILVANSGNALSTLTLGSSGYVLQSNGTALVYGTLDGGTF